MSTTTKFSGPWHVVNDSQGFDNIHHAPADDGDTGDIVATCYQDSEHVRLIAAAPELYEELTEARTTLSVLRTQIMVEIGRCPDPSESRWEGVPEKLKERIDGIDAALAKARGEVVS